MPVSAVEHGAHVADGYLLVLALVVPVAAILATIALGLRHAERAALIALPIGLAIAASIVAAAWRAQAPLVYAIGGWSPPLGIALRADGLSGAMLVTTGVVLCAVAFFARSSGDGDGPSPTFWTLLLGIAGGLDAVWLAGDLFTLYVALELLTFSAVPLVCLDGRAETLAAALRYLLFALLGSSLYLLGVALLYGAYGTLDIFQLSQRVTVTSGVSLAAGLMTTGMLAKTALFPLQLWLPPAHSGAPPAASAVLSALVVKASFFVIVRLWFDVLPRLPMAAVAHILGGLGAAAIVFGSVLALRQARLKLLVAYSTVAQIGYLFLLFPLAAGGLPPVWNSIAWTGGILQLVSHAIAKAAMFMAAGLMSDTLGHDRIAGLSGIGRAMPMTVVAFGLGGMSLMGLPPSGGFVAKLMLLTAAVNEGHWWLSVTILLGGLLAGGYVLRVLSSAMAGAIGPLPTRTPVLRRREAIVLTLAACAVLLGLVPLRPSELLEIGRPPAALAAR